MPKIRAAAWGPLLMVSGFVCLAACGDGSGSGAAATPTVTVTPTVSATPNTVGGRVFALAFHASGRSVVRSENGGQSFARVFDADAGGPQLRRLAFVDESRGWAIGSRHPGMSSILHTSDGGVSWVSQTENIVVDDETLVRLQDIAFSSAERGVAVGSVVDVPALSDPPVILSTVDGGAEWSVLTFPGSHRTTLQSVCLTAGGTGLAVGPSRVVRTDDGGATWRDITTELELFGTDLRTVSCTETGQFWIGGESVRRLGLMPGSSHETVLFSPDDGGTWLGRSPPSLANTQDVVTSIASIDELNGWALAEDHTTVFHTDDAGATWVEQALPVGAAPGRVHLNALDFRDSQRGVIVGVTVPEDESPNRPLVFTTADGGDTWVRGTVPDDVRGLSDVAFVP